MIISLFRLPDEPVAYLWVNIWLILNQIIERYLLSDFCINSYQSEIIR
jgi:hypothetical protein